MSAIAIGDAIVVYTGPLLEAMQLYLGLCLFGMLLVATMIAGRVAIEVVGGLVDATSEALKPLFRQLVREIRGRVELELLRRQTRLAELAEREAFRRSRVQQG